MPAPVVIPGHLVDSSTVKLDTPAPPSADAEVEVRVRSTTEAAAKKLSQILRELPPGIRSDADIDEQIRAERESWDE